MQLADFLPRFLQEELHVPQLVLWICVSRHSLLPRGEVSQPRLVWTASQQKGRERPVGRPDLGSHTSLHWGRHARALPDAARLDLNDIAECSTRRTANTLRWDSSASCSCSLSRSHCTGKKVTSPLR